MLGWLVYGAAPQAAIGQIGQPQSVKVVVTSADLSQRLVRLPDLKFATSPPRGAEVIDVDDAVRYQHINGFGGAMTDTSAWLLRDELSPSSRAEVMNDLFGTTGIHLNFIRLPMGASDFTRNGTPYTYDDLPPGQTDPRLLHFSIGHDRPYIIPAVQQALAINPQMEILANPWSPPAWMKANDSLNNQGYQGVLLNSAYAPLARYFVRFLQAYAGVGIKIAAITPQNEPTNPTRYPGLQLDSGGEARFITKYLAPALHRAGLHPEIYGHDYGWSASSDAYADAIATGPAAGTLTGIAWHCYFGGPGVMSALHRLAPRLDEIVDECSPGLIPYSVSELVIFTMRNWASLVALWNFALDPHGGPVEPPNRGCPTCTGIVTVNQRTHTVRFTQAFFQLGQASSFVEPGAQRIKSNTFVTYRYPGPGVNVAGPGLDDVAVVNPDASHVLIAYDNAARSISFAVRWRRRAFSYTLSPGETATFVWG
jgi:glucosylceramidase